jgi:2-polyprenyl-3-methyl-5-hydroxy-6-metoxy-1,4-benzoquinol methylase
VTERPAGSPWPTTDIDAMRSRIRELSPWYQNVELGPGLATKLVDPNAIHPDEDTPGPLWREIAPRLPPLAGKLVLDIGCNAGYMSFECKKLGAEYVLGIDDDSSAPTSFIDQAEFCRDVLGLDVEFRRLSFMDLEPERPFDVVLFCGVLYHLQNWADGLDKVVELVVSGDGVIVLETAIEPITRTTYEGKGYRGDTTTFFVPSMRVLLALLDERSLVVREVVDLGERALVLAASPRL